MFCGDQLPQGEHLTKYWSSASAMDTGSKWLYERLTVTAAAVLFAGPLAASSDPMKTQSNSENAFPEWDELTGRK